GGPRLRDRLLLGLLPALRAFRRVHRHDRPAGGAFGERVLGRFHAVPGPAANAIVISPPLSELIGWRGPTRRSDRKRRGGVLSPRLRVRASASQATGHGSARPGRATPRASASPCGRG